MSRKSKIEANSDTIQFDSDFILQAPYLTNLCVDPCVIQTLCIWNVWQILILHLFVSLPLAQVHETTHVREEERVAALVILDQNGSVVERVLTHLHNVTVLIL